MHTVTDAATATTQAKGSKVKLIRNVLMDVELNRNEM